MAIGHPFPRAPASTMIWAPDLADEPGPVFAQGVTDEGRGGLAAWCSPWRVVEHINAGGEGFGRAWRLNDLRILFINLNSDLPQATSTGRPESRGPDRVGVA